MDHKKTNVDEASSYYNLAILYQSEQRLQEAADAVYTSLQHYQLLALEDLKEYWGSLSGCLVLWINLQSSHSSATSHDQQMLSEVNSLFDKHHSVVEKEIWRLEEYSNLLTATVRDIDQPTVAITVNEGVVARLRSLAEQFPEEAGMTYLEQLRNHGLLLEQFGRLSESAAWFQKVIEEHRGNHEIGVWCITVALDLVHVLQDQGRFEDYRKVLETASEGGKIACFSTMFMITRVAAIESMLGNVGDSLGLCEEAVALRQVRESDENITIPHLQYSRSLTAVGRYDEAFAMAQSSLATLRANMTCDSTRYHNHRYLWPSEHMRTMALCYADSGNITRAATVVKSAVDEAQKVKLADGHLIQITLRKVAEACYGASLWTEGCIHLFSGDREASIRALEKAKELWKGRSDERKFDKRELALTLWTLGIAYCLVGRHEDGTDAHEDLQRIINGFKFAHPTMHRVVTVAIDQERGRPVWARFLTEVQGGLNCGHLLKVDIDENKGN